MAERAAAPEASERAPLGQSMREYFREIGIPRVLIGVFLLSLFAGLYSVPMYALIQLRSQASHRARIIAANNILNSLFIIVSALIVGALRSGNSTPSCLN